ncbi:MAG: HAD family hydrolase [Deltaproteobacteria bacterium]|nr:HAD family hydrolase [Deltaproteobacteria bacterium]
MTPFPAVFLDRDGTLNADIGYLWQWTDWRWLPGIPESLVRLKEAGLKLIVVSNQAGIAKGLYSPADVTELHRQANQDLLTKWNLTLDGLYFCPHHPDYEKCDCRKPAPGLILRAASEHNIDLKISYLAGDKLSDVQAGLAAGLKPYLVRTGHGLLEEPLCPPEITIARDLNEVADLILANFSRN